MSAAPVLVGDKPWSVLLVGSGSADALARSLHLSTVIDAAALTALVVAPRLHTATDAEQVRQELGVILRTAAFFPVFQPVVELSSRRVVGFEALTRFTDGERPDLRFSAAHRVGIGTRLEAATLRAILAQEPYLPGDTWLSINASPSLIVEGDTLPRLAGPVERPLVVEITEHDPVDDYGSIRASLSRLGPEVRLSVDDAGAGYASLRHVLALAPAFLKLDRSWVAGVDGDTNRRELLAGIALFAERTGCTLIAEGIERQEEVDVLEELGVPLGQGYLLGRPAPLEIPAARRSRGRRTTRDVSVVTPAELDDLRADVVLVLAHVTEGVAHATAAFLSADLVDVERVVAGDDAVDDLNRRIEARVHDLLARHPDAGEVEVLVGILRTLHELELSGDLVANIAKGARRIYPHPLDPKVRGLVDRMGRQAVEQLRAATDAFADRNPSLAAAVADMDTVMDDLTKDLLRAVFRGGAGDETAVQHAVQVALVGRYFERIGDHARIIAERVAKPM